MYILIKNNIINGPIPVIYARISLACYEKFQTEAL